MDKARPPLICSFLLLLATLFCGAQDFSKVDSLLAASHAQNHFNGTVVIAHRGNVLFEKSYGFADIKTKAPFTQNSTFQIASVSKQFTALGIQLLKAKGQLQYDDPVQTYLPQFPYTNITIRHLMNHTSGLPDFWNNIRPHLDHSKSNGNREMLDYLVEKNLPLQHEPGAKWIYADIGYDLLAMIIEKCTGQDFETFMHRQIFQPAGMNDTKALPVTDIRKIASKHQVMGHEVSKDGSAIEYAHELKKNDFVFYLGNFYGDGSVISSARDLLKWSKTLSASQLLSQAVFGEALQPAMVKNAAGSESAIQPLYGFGWFLGRDSVAGDYYFHGGGHPGFVSYFAKFPKEDLTIIFLSNLQSAQTSKIRMKLVGLTLRIWKSRG